MVAECKLGRGTRAMEFYDALLPYHQNDMIEVREAEPYSYVQFVMGKDHTAHGRGRHPWLTGSGGWAYYAATHWMLGVRPGYKELIVDPCIPGAWPGFTVNRKWRGAMYDITVENPQHVEKGIVSISLNGKSIGKTIPPQPAGSVNTVVVVMG
jgi:N,N'-diacetylchitobiose phosphorylase